MKIGTTLSLEQGEDLYRSRLVEERDGEWLIDLPIHRGKNRTTFMQEGTSLRISFTGEDSALYVFETKIKNRELGKIPMLVLEAPKKEDLFRYQRREFVRIEDSVDVAVHPKEERFPPFTTITVDLSGGGIAIRLPKSHGLKENMQVHCWIALPRQSDQMNYLLVACKVVRIFHPNSEPFETASLLFMSIQEKERQQIIRYCYDQQLARARKTKTP